MRRPQLPAGFRTQPRFLALGAFLFAGELKAGPLLARIPVDLTVLAGGALALILLARWAGGARAGSGPGLGLIAVWFLTFLPGAAAAADTAYAFQKVATLYSFSLLAALAPFVLIRDGRDLEGFLNAVAGFCLIMTLDGLTAAGQGGQRLETAAGTIALGRAAGFLFLSGMVHLAGPGRLSPAALAVTAAAAVAAAFSGSRGPMAGAVLAVAAALGSGRTLPGAGRRNLFLGMGAVLVVLGLSLSLAPAGSLRRTGDFLQGRFGASERYRASAARAAWRLLQAAPWGAGWGGFAVQADLDSGSGRQYPHNLLLEATLESGWACGAATLLVLGAALAAAWPGRRQTGGRILFAGLVFWIVNGMVSGDLNDNRTLFAFLGAALCRRPAAPVLEVRP